MNSSERKMVDLLKELKDEYGLTGIKTEFEAEGARMEELCRLKDITSRVGLEISLKIGGSEHATGIKMAKVIGVERIVAPMIESTFALSKFISCAKSNLTEDELSDVELSVNIETITGYNDFDNMLASPAFSSLGGVVIGRGDMTFSMGKTGEFMNSEELRGMTQSLFERTKEKFPNYECVVGGVPNSKSFLFLRAFKPGLVDMFEARKVIFRAPDAYDAKMQEGFIKGLEFELMWYKNKADFYGGIASEDARKIQMVESNYQEMLA
jgi:4-hydroxy-2-oxoheptanedioate aldolase